jgi:hypothetical protein
VKNNTTFVTKVPKFMTISEQPSIKIIPKRPNIPLEVQFLFCLPYVTVTSSMLLPPFRRSLVLYSTYLLRFTLQTELNLICIMLVQDCRNLPDHSGHTTTLGSIQPLKSNKYHGYLLGVKGGRCVWLTTLPILCSGCL